MRRATIHDVAAAAGVSVATVSRVLNDKGVVREDTSTRVREVARELRYSPNLAARSLSIRRHHTIGVVLPEVHGEFFSEVIRGVDIGARRAGYHILVSGSHSNRDEMLEVLKAMHGRVDALIVMTPDLPLSTLQQHIFSELPLVLVNSQSDQRDAVAVDNFGGARSMVRHLIERGHRRIAFIKGPVNNADAAERLRGYRRGMKEAGVGAEALLECQGDFGEQSGYTAVLEVLRIAPRPTAIFAANDAMAVGALAALGEHGIAVPDQMAVVGFDDIPIARYLAPPLTTVHVDIAALGRRALELALDSMEGRADQPRRECIPTSLVVRQSCGSGRASPRTQAVKNQRKLQEDA